MRGSRMRFGRAVAAVALASALVAAGCSRSGDPEAEQTPAERSKWEPGMINIPEAGSPVSGGELAFGGYNEPRSLDPAVTVTAGPTGGIEMGAIYGFLMRWDSDTGELVPELAESLEANDDFTTWTLKLRDGVTFSNGKPFDADAIQWSIDRYMKLPVDEAKMWKANVTSVDQPDSRTLVFHLAKTWPTFGYMMTTAPGMIVGEGSDGATPQDFKPIGAGPYVLDRHVPGEELVLKARDDYWRGEVNIKTIRVTYLGDPSAIADSMRSNGIQMAMIRNAQIVDEFLGAKQPGFLNMVPMGNVAIINAMEGKAGSDVRVRKALQLAVDPQVVVDRAYGGAGYPSSELFPEISSWHSGAEALGYGPDEARKLVEEAKADGFDGKITYTQIGTPDAREQAFALKAMWDAVGFETELDILRNPQELGPRVFLERDYEVSTWGLSWREAEPWARAAATMHSSGNTLGMATSPEMDALIDELQGARTKDDAKEILGKIQELWNEEVPAVMLGPAPDYVLWSDKLHGVKSHINAMVVLDEAWLDQG